MVVEALCNGHKVTGLRVGAHNVGRYFPSTSRSSSCNWVIFTFIASWRLIFGMASRRLKIPAYVPGCSPGTSTDGRVEHQFLWQ